jgi:hypothetical protein
LDVATWAGVIAAVILLVGVLSLGGVLQVMEFVLFNQSDVSTALVVITAISTWQARSTVAEMRAGREAEYMPVLRSYLSMAQVPIVSLMLKNAGRGPAMDASLLINFTKNGTIVETRPFKRIVLAPQQDVELIMKEMQFDRLLDSLTLIEITGDAV